MQTTLANQPETNTTPVQTTKDNNIGNQPQPKVKPCLNKQAQQHSHNNRTRITKMCANTQTQQQW